MTATAVGPVFAALADDTRRTVLETVGSRGSATATALASTLPVSRQAIAKHLTILQAAGLVASQRAGRETVYQVVPGSLRPLSEWAAATESAWTGRLGRLRDHLSNRRA